MAGPERWGRRALGEGSGVGASCNNDAQHNERCEGNYSSCSLFHGSVSAVERLNLALIAVFLEVMGYVPGEVRADPQDRTADLPFRVGVARYLFVFIR